MRWRHARAQSGALHGALTGMLIGLVLALGCTPAPPPAAPESTEIATSFYPLYWMAKTLAGSDVPVYLAPPAEVDPATWAPDDAAIQRLQRARRILVNGAGFESFLHSTSLPLSRLIDTTASQRMRLRSAPAHQHPGGVAHGTDPHVWLDPQRARQQLAAVQAALAPWVDAAALARRAATVRAGLDRIDAALQALKPGDQVVLANHRAYDYLAARAGLTVHSLDVAPDAPPIEAQAVCTVARRIKARLMLFEAAPSPPLADALAACGVQTIELRPLERPPPEGDYVSAHLADLARLAKALRGR